MLSYGVWGLFRIHHGTFLFDSGELAGTAFELGAGHPPGQPLYALLLYAMSLIPLGAVMFRMSLVSLLCSVLALKIFLEILEQRLPKQRWFACLFGLMFVLHPIVLRQAGHVELYSFAQVLFLLGFKSIEDSIQKDTHNARGWFWAGLLSVVNLPYAFALSAALLLMVLCQPNHKKRWRLSWKDAGGALMFLFGLLLNASLWVRSHSQSRMWGDASTWQGWVNYALARAYSKNMGRTSDVLRHVEELWWLMWPCFLGAVLGVYFWRSRKLSLAQQTWFASVMGAAVASLVFVLPTVLDLGLPDHQAYLFPLWLMLLFLPWQLWKGGPYRWWVSFAILGLSWWPERNRLGFIHVDAKAEQYEFETVDQVTPRAFVLSKHDYLDGVWSRYESIEAMRPDVAMMIEGMASSRWHWKHLNHHPLFQVEPIGIKRRDAQNPWVMGALSLTLGHVDVYTEEKQPALKAGRNCGPYFVYAVTSGWEDRNHAYVREVLEGIMNCNATDFRWGKDKELYCQWMHREAFEQLEGYLMHQHDTDPASLLNSFVPSGYSLLKDIERTHLQQGMMKLAPVYDRHYLYSRNEIRQLLSIRLMAMGHWALAEALLSLNLKEGDPASYALLKQLKQRLIQ